MGPRSVPSLRDVGDDVAGAAVGVEPVERLPEVAALAGPAAGGERRAADVEADGDPVAEPAIAVAGPVRVLQGGGAEVDPGAAGGHRGLEATSSSRMPPDSSTCDVELADDLGQQLAVAAAAERGVEVDQVDPLGAAPTARQRGVERVAVAGLAAGLALHQPDGLAVGDVDGGQQLEPGSSARVIGSASGRRT